MYNMLSQDEKYATFNSPVFLCLDEKDVITAKVSDHHPIIHNGVLFWNVMMRGAKTIRDNKVRYNNGFATTESEKQYLYRLMKIAQVIAEIVSHHPIESIGLCEGPIESFHVNYFFQCLKQFVCMQRFLKNNQFFKPNVDPYPNWGLLMLTDKKNTVKEVRCPLIESSTRFKFLANRLQLWQLTHHNQTKYLALAHFPFGHGDEQATAMDNLSEAATWYCGLIKHILNQYVNERFVMCADFNFNPYLIGRWQERLLDQISPNNSVVIMGEGSKTVTVDGILLSNNEKQRHHTLLPPSPRLFTRLKYEYGLFKSYVDKTLEKTKQLYNEHSGLLTC